MVQLVIFRLEHNEFRALAHGMDASEVGGRVDVGVGGRRDGDFRDRS